jgi:hypothetical protein
MSFRDDELPESPGIGNEPGIAPRRLASPAAAALATPDHGHCCSQVAGSKCVHPWADGNNFSRELMADYRTLWKRLSFAAGHMYIRAADPAASDSQNDISRGGCGIGQ